MVSLIKLSPFVQRVAPNSMPQSFEMKELIPALSFELKTLPNKVTPTAPRFVAFPFAGPNREEGISQTAELPLESGATKKVTKAPEPPFVSHAKNIYTVYSKALALPLSASKFYNTATHHSTPDYVNAYNVLDLLSTGNSVMSIAQGRLQLKRAKKINDSVGLFFANMSLARSGVKLLSTVLVVPLQVYQCVESIARHMKVRPLAGGIKAFQKSISVLANLLTLIPNTYKTFLSLRFGKRFYDHVYRDNILPEQRAVEGLKFLRGCFTVEQEDLDKGIALIEKKWGTYQSTKPFGEKQNEKYKDVIPFVEAEIKRRIQRLESQMIVDFDHLKRLKNPSYKAALCKEVKKQKERKIAALSRNVGVDAFQALKKEFAKPLAEQLLSRAAKGDDVKEAIEALVKKTWTGITIETMLRGALALTGIIGLGLTATSLFALGTIGSLITIGIGMITSAVIVGVGLYDLAMSFKHKATGRYDALFLFLGGLVVAAAVTLGCIMTTGLAGYILLAAIVATWLILSVSLVAYRAYINRAKSLS